MADTASEKKHCCLSHEFVRAAQNNPNKIAVIHASGCCRIIKEARSNVATESDFYRRRDHQLSSELLVESPPVYKGDQCFTFSEVLASVDSLSSRLRRILDGGDDPYVIKPRGFSCCEHLAHAQIFKNSISFEPSIAKSAEVRNMCTPKILGIYMDPSAEYIISVLSVLRSGEAFVPLDPSWPKERLLSILSSSDLDLIIGRRSAFDTSSFHHKSHWLVNCSRCPILSFSMKDNLQEHIGPSNLVWPCENIKLRLFCYLLYTSGSTGKPKGVCGSEKGLLNRFLWMQEMYPLLGEELLLFKTPTSFIDHLQEFLGAVLTASTLVIPPFNELKESPFYVIDFLQAYCINRLIAVPTLMRAILPALHSQHNMKIRSFLKLLVLSGEVFSLSLWDKLSIILPETSILNLYGSTEVKSQPVFDKHRQLVWCGSHDHNLYALDYKNNCCLYKHSCGGSIYGSPAIDEALDKLYVATTNGRVIAILIEASPFSILWQQELGVPVFGSLFISSNGNVICCMVDGHVVSLGSSGSISWRCTVGGPVFAGACISYALPSQVLVCSRNGSIYSFELEKGNLLWEYNVGDPITASAYVDENLQLVSDPSVSSDRLICVCTSSGRIYLLRINLNGTGNDVVEEFARLDLKGDVFSSPVMIGGRIYVGCRDDYVHCIAIEGHLSKQCH